MTVSEFAIQMYGCEIIKDTCIVIKDTKFVYEGRMEFLRYAHENDEDMLFTNEVIKKVEMYCADARIVSKKLSYTPDYITIIYI